MPLRLRVKIDANRSHAAAQLATDPQAVVCVVGPSDYLGNWDPKRSPKMQRVPGTGGAHSKRWSTTWECELRDDLMPPGTEFKHCVLQPEKHEYAWEQHCQHTVPEAAPKILEHTFDVHQVELLSPTLIAREEASRSATDGMMTSTLRVTVSAASSGGHINAVVVCGEGPRLGGWNPAAAPSMAKVGSNVWELQVDALPGTKFKYVLLRPDGPRWEENRPNREFEEMLADAAPHIFDKKDTQEKATVKKEAPVEVFKPVEVSKLAKQGGVVQVDPPVWARDRVWYQIYPLGFFGCPLKNDHTGPVRQTLAGLEAWCDHLKRLGVGVILLNPIFESDCHGYDTTDYYQIDRRLGDVESFRNLVRTLASLDLRIVVDGVFNHTGRNFFAFKDCIANGLSSKYAGWYHLRSGRSPMGDNFQYDAWEGHASLPRLNLSNPEVKRYIFDVGRYWLSDVGVDGWRLDVAHEISPAFWREFHRECVEVAPDVCLLGELMHGDYRNFVEPGVLHSGTNYQLSHGLWHSLNDKNYFELAHALDRCSTMYKGLTLLEFLGNHDVTRLYTKLKVKNHFQLATAALLLAVKGMPCLYYGDEYGMEGRNTKEGGAPNDADVRKVPPRPETLYPRSRQLFDCVAQMLAVRSAFSSLSRGEPFLVGNSNEQMVIWRDFEGLEFALLIFNCGAKTDFVLPAYVQPRPVVCPEGLVLEQVCGYSNGETMAVMQQITMRAGKPQAQAGLLPNSVSVFVGRA